MKALVARAGMGVGVRFSFSASADPLEAAEHVDGEIAIERAHDDAAADATVIIAAGALALRSRMRASAATSWLRYESASARAALRSVSMILRDSCAFSSLASNSLCSALLRALIALCCRSYSAAFSSELISFCFIAVICLGAQIHRASDECV